ncbi:MAG: tRNA (adenosine(37)-N6)-dimethylallyltransferase MiaA [Acuticoccus sp.]
MTVLIAGPTASGKSSLAMTLAERLGGVIVNADAMQVYRDLRVLTARPSVAEERAVPHALFGTVDAAEAHSVAAWLADMRTALAQAAAAGRRPIVVGGTGLYLAALTEGLSPMPPVPDDVRAFWREGRAASASEELHAELARRDARMAARLRPSDRQRVVRALEVFEATGRSLADWQGERAAPLVSPTDAVRIVIAPPREALRAAIAARFDTMMDEGAVAEAAALSARNLDAGLPAMKAIGVRPLADYAAGRLDRSHAIDQSVTESRQYAKRQETWFRHRFADWTRVANGAEGVALVAGAAPLGGG